MDQIYLDPISHDSSYLDNKDQKEQKKKHYTHFFKMQVLYELDILKSIKKVAKKFCIHEKTIWRWKNKGISRQKRTRKIYKIRDIELFNDLKFWYQNQEHSPNYQQIKAKALELSHSQNFKASYNWMNNFIKRINQ